MKNGFDQWLADTAEECGIEGGQGRSGGEVLFAALTVCGGLTAGFALLGICCIAEFLI